MQINSLWMSEIERWVNITKDKVEFHLHRLNLSLNIVFLHSVCHGTLKFGMKFNLFICFLNCNFFCYTG